MNLQEARADHLRLGPKFIYCAVTYKVATLNRGANHNWCGVCGFILHNNNQPGISCFMDQFIGYSLTDTARSKPRLPQPKQVGQAS